MLGIFDDEERESGQNGTNPFRTRAISPLDVALNRLKWSTLRRASWLASNEMARADAAAINQDRP